MQTAGIKTILIDYTEITGMGINYYTVQNACNCEHFLTCKAPLSDNEYYDFQDIFKDDR